MARRAGGKARGFRVARRNRTEVSEGTAWLYAINYFPAASVGAGGTPFAAGVAAGSASLPPKLTT